MLKGLLLRAASTSQGTSGVLFLDSFQLFTMELPYLSNLPEKSSIPEGIYLCKWKFSRKFGWCYQVVGVPNRGNILIHAGNFAGNKEDGWRTDSHGCILPCMKIGRIEGQLAGLLSKPALRKINAIGKKETFELEIRNA